MSLFEQTLKPASSTRILDVGGSPLIWKFSPIRPRLTFINLPGALVVERRDANCFVAGDARMLPFPDKSFDIVFSNSVIEHVGSEEDQRLFAKEAARVGRSYWIQTPNRTFPIELHMMMPLVHFLPKYVQRAVLNRFMVWELFVQPTGEEREWFVNHLLNELNLLDASSLQLLFPEANILRERVLGFTKSLVAFHQ